MYKQLFHFCILICFCLQATAQTLEKVAEINTGFGSSNPYNFTAVGNKLFFVAKDATNQFALYVSTGTEASTQKVSPSTLLSGTIYSMVSYNNQLYFTANDGVNGQELWTSDGTAAGTVLFKDLYPGSTGSFPDAFTVANGKLFFLGNTADGNNRLFVTDGTAAGTIILRNMNIQLFNGFSNFAVMNNEIYFKGDGFPTYPYGLWKSDGTLAGTSLVKADGLVPGTLGSNYAVLNNKLYFSGTETTTGGELWVTDGTTLGTHIVINLRADGNGIIYSGSPMALTVFNSKIYFSASDDTHGQELFETDGTAAGTLLVKDILPGASGSVPAEITINNGSLYLICNGLQELWKSDGTAAGTQLVKQVQLFSRFGAVWNNNMYLISSSSQYLSQSDGTPAGTGYATATNVPSNTLIGIYNNDLTMTPFNGSLYFGGSCNIISPSVEPLKLVPTIVSTNFSFTGNGNWSNPANWAGGLVPPATLMAGNVVVINGNCILDITVHAQAGSSITVAAGKSLTIVGSLTIM